MAATQTPTDAELRQYEQLVTSVVARRYGNLDRSDIEDLCQQAFLETWPKRAEYNGAYPNLLVTTALRRASDHWRRYQSRHAPGDHEAHFAALPSDDGDPAETVLRDVELRRGAELLSMLPPHHQRIWRAYCDSGAKHSPTAIAAIAEAENLKPRQITKVIDKVKEKARRIAAASLTEDLEVDAAYCGRLEARIAAHLAGATDPIAAGHLSDCARCRALFERSRTIERAAAALLPPIPLLHELTAFGAAGAVATPAVITTAKAIVAAGVLAVGGGGTAVVIAGDDPTPPRPAPHVVEYEPPAPIAPRGSAAPAAPKAKPAPRRVRVTPKAETPAARPPATPQPQAETPAAEQPEFAPEPQATPAKPEPRTPTGDDGEFGFDN